MCVLIAACRRSRSKNVAGRFPRGQGGITHQPPLLETAKKRAGFVPRIFVTDGLPSFGVAFQKVFWTLKNAAVHISEIHLRGGRCNNNGHERLNGELGDRFKISRGLKRDDAPLIRMAILHHNFIRSHRGLGGRAPPRRPG